MNLTEPRSTLNETTSLGGFFVTGTDTDVGKTFVSGCLAMNLLNEGRLIAPRKPIASGCQRQTDGSLLAEDALFLQQASQSTEKLDTICPYQFEPAISPHTAIKRAALSITISDLALACKTADKQFALVEGSGGFFSPIAKDGINRDLAKKLAYPVILVVENRLGCINHTLLTLDAIESSGLYVHSIILNQTCSESRTDYAEGLEDFTSYPIFKVNYSKDQQAKQIDGWHSQL